MTKARLFIAAFLLAFVLPLAAQTPRVYLKFDGDLSDSSGTGIITSVTASTGFTPTYVADRFGVANKAIQFPTTGAASLQLIASSLLNNSNQALGLRNASGTNTSFTLCAWVYFNGVGSGQGYNTVFGNLGTGAGTLHAGLNTNSDKTHFGFDGNDVSGGACSLVGGQWYHLAFVYDTTATNGQRVYVNGIPDVTRTSVTNTLKSADLLIGNWNTATDSSNDFRGRLDDVVVYNTALKGDQILALANGGDPMAVPTAGTYFAPPTTYGYRGTTGMWGIREIKGYPGITYSSMVNIDRILKAQATTPGGTVANYWAPVINFTDDEGPGNLGNFDSEGDFATNTAGADDNFLLFARCTIKIPTAGNYTFGFRSDDGARLRIVGKAFTSSTRIATGNNADPANIGDTLIHPNSSGDSNTLGVVNLAAGEYDLEFSYWEGSGGCAVEVFAAPGSKTSFDSTFQLIGNTAAGGLEIVRDSDTIPTLTVNSSSSLFVHSGSPSSMTLAWAVNEPTTVLSIDNGIGTVAQTGNLTIPTPSVTTTYTITAVTGPDTVTRTVTVYVNTPPIVTISANDTTVLPNAAVTLSWTALGATSLTLNPGNINVTGTTSRTVNPSSTTTYTLTATNPAGSTSQSVTVTTGSAPVISSFTSPDASPIYGKDTSLTWSITGSDSQSINQGIGSIPATGSINVVPLLTTTYTLTATNAFGSSTATKTITLPTPLGVSSSGFTARRVSSTTPFPFTGLGYLQSAINLLAGQNAGTTTTQSGYTTINFTDGADGDYTSGNVAFPGGSGDNFAVEITGTLIVNTPGEYTFMVSSDDGCRLRIDGADVIVDDATHNPTTSSGKVVLSKATAQFQLIYYDVTGGAEVEVSWVRPNLTWQQLTTATAASPIVRGGVLISEFCASNSSTLNDEDGASSDWIEIWNSTNSPVNLAGYYLSTNAATPTQWALPSKTLAANEYLIVFASGKNRVNPAATLHTNFTLSAGGGYLALKRDNGAGGYVTLTEFNPYPAQQKDITYGSSDAEGYIGFMEVPTPGLPNAASYIGFAQPVTFSRQRGRCTAPFSLTLSTATPGAEIRYTLDGSAPSFYNGAIYTGPLSVTGTSVVRACAVLAGWKPSEIVTHSYLFIDDIVNQNTTYTVGRGWPATAVNGQVYRYGLNLAAVTSGGGTLASLKSALAAAPSVCLNMTPDDFFGVSNGIYSNPGKRGRFWERNASLEFINPDGTGAFQKDCGVRIRGNASRSTSNPKHAFHLYFRGLYAGALDYPLFGSEGTVTHFNQIDMRCEENNSWSKDNSSLNALLREEWSRKTQGDQGQLYSRSSYFHLYINGIYWGVFNWEEKTEADFAASQLGGDDTDYDTVKSAGGGGSYNTEMTDGNDIAWKALFNLCLSLKSETTDAGRNLRYFQMMGLNADATRNPNYPIYLDADNLIDYMLVVFYDGSFDSPMSTFLANASNNWFGFRRRDGTAGGFKFFAHDQEHGMGTANTSYNRVGPWGDPTATGNNWGQTWTTSQYRSRETYSKFNPQYLHEFLCFSPEYRRRFSDRVAKHFFGTGALTQAASIARVSAMATQVDAIIHAEAARWGSSSLTRNTWLTAKAGVDSFINSGGSSVSGQTTWPAQPRTTLVLEQLKGYTDEGAKPLYIALTPPVFSGQAGGIVAGPYSFQITNPNSSGTIYYTTDGSDPRAIGGGPSPSAISSTSAVNLTLTNVTTVRARVFDSTLQDWSGLTDQTYLVGEAGSASNLVVSKVHYHPGPGVTNGEFLEITNIGSKNAVLTNCRFTVGITFTFPANYVLAPGARCLLVEDSSAFAAANPGVSSSLIAGVYAGSLSNGGERLVFVDGAGATIKDFTYGTIAPWPSAPDGGGPCLVLIKPETNPDHNLASNWRSSLVNGGLPGGVDGVRLSSWLTTYGIANATGFGDADKDGLPDFLEYALGLNPTAANGSGSVVATQNIGGVDYLTLTVTRPLGMDDVASVQAEACTNLGSWTAAVLVSVTTNGNGTETLLFRHPNPRSADLSQFIRLRVSK